MKKNINSFLVYLISFIYLELLFKIISHSFNLNIINNLLFILFFCLICLVLSSFKSKKANMIIMDIIIGLVSLYYSIQIVVYNIFGFYFDFSLFGATDQVMKFAGDMFNLIFKNIFYVLLIFLPLILIIIFHKKIDYKHLNYKKNLIILVISGITYCAFLLSLNIAKSEDYSAYQLFYNQHNIELSLKKLGVLDTFFIDFKRSIFGFEEKIEILPNTPDEEGDKGPKSYALNNLDLDFDALINSSSGTLKTMHEYFQNETGTYQNEYTGLFKDKNLILFMAESFNEIGVDKDRTPTLYKLIHSGFVFEDFYTPTISSTIGGEFQELTGLVAASGFLSPWKSGKNSYPFGIARMFQNAGYSTFAYHDHTYTFQSRNNYLAALGFTNYLGCRNGLEAKINCNIWPESDVEMIEATFDDYKDSEHPFFTYYVTVSGHGDYSWGNAMSKKHREEVSELPYSENTKAYLATQIELDKALELLIEKLEEAGILDDTVIALVGDHYPYFLDVDEVNEAASYSKDGVVEINHSNFILWNNKMDTVKVSKVGSQIDVLPTIYNLYGLPYDSRLIIGKDILSTTEGLAIFGNASWVSDYGTYFSAQGKFVAKEGKEIPEGYVQSMNRKVSNKINMSKLIMTEDYYKYFN